MSDYGRELMARMEAADNLEVKSKILAYFKIFLNDYIGGRPDNLVTAKTPGYSIHKCRKSFFFECRKIYE